MFERRECAPNLRVSKLFIQHVQLPSVVMEYFLVHTAKTDIKIPYLIGTGISTKTWKSI